MLATLLTSVLAILMALVWIGVCLLPLTLAWGIWIWLRSPSQAEQGEAEIEEHSALIAECQALQAESKALLAIRR